MKGCLIDKKEVFEFYQYLLKDEDGKEFQVRGTGILNRFVN